MMGAGQFFSIWGYYLTVKHKAVAKPQGMGSFMKFTKRGWIYCLGVICTLLGLIMISISLMLFFG